MANRSRYDGAVHRSAKVDGNHHDNESRKQPDLWTVLTIRSRLYSQDALPFTEFFEDSLEHLGDSERIAWWKLYEELISQLLEELQNEPEAEQVGNFCIEDRSPRNLDTCESIRQSWKIRNCGTMCSQSRSLEKQ